jgi:integrase
MRKSLTDKGVSALKPRTSRYAYPDPELAGHYVRVTPNGARSFAAVARSPDGKQIWTTFGPTDRMSIATARELARDAIKRVRAGLPAIEPKAESFETVARQWLERHAQKNRLRSEKQITRLLQVHVFPFWKGRAFLGIKRSDVAALLDDVQDNHGARQADLVLTIVRSIMNWFATRNDDYHPPIIRGMRRQNPKEQTRKRILSDDEIRTIWKAAEDSGTFGAIVRMCLLTAQRNGKVSTMRWADISADGEWTIPKEAREKDSGGVLVLPEAALAIIRGRHQIGDSPYVFASVRGNGPFRGFSATKLTFDAKLPPDLPGWVIHDLRRTARSLMSRAGVLSEHAERVMGHALAGVEGVYDRHSYRDEKADALRRLSTLIDGIVNPRANVLPLQKRPKRR